MLSAVGDMNLMGGQIISGAPTVVVTGKPVAYIGSSVSAHAPWGPAHPPHALSVVSSGNQTILAQFRPVAKVGSMTTCGHQIVSGAATVKVL